jgi:hypothetical protein
MESRGKKNLIRNSLRRNPNWHKARLIVERTAISSCEEEEEEEANIKPKILDVCHSSWAEQVFKADQTRTVPSGRLLV